MSNTKNFCMGPSQHLHQSFTEAVLLLVGHIFNIVKLLLKSLPLLNKKIFFYNLNNKNISNCNITASFIF